MSRRLILIIVLVLAVVGGGVAWYMLSRPKLPAGFAGGNGRLEATEVYVSAKYPGRIKEVLFDEGATVEAGQVVARMDVEPLEAQLRQAQAEIVAAQDRAATSPWPRWTSRRPTTPSPRSNTSGPGGLSPRAPSASRKPRSIRPACWPPRPSWWAPRRPATQTAIEDRRAAQATADRLKAEIADSGPGLADQGVRVETRLAEPGEVLASGGRVYSLTDLSDVYMYVFLPERITGKVPVGLRSSDRPRRRSRSIRSRPTSPSYRRWRSSRRRQWRRRRSGMT